MRKIREISEDEMIAIFLQTEFHSSRFHQAIGELMQQEGIDPHVVEAPDCYNVHENVLRRALLGVYRGYGRNADYFQGFPADVRWEWVILTRKELEQVRYIEYDYWVELSKVVFSVSSDGLVYMANQLRQGAQFPPLILVTKNVDAYLVVMEGHVRLTAYLIVPEYIPSELEVILGTSPQITNWGCY